MTPRAAKKSVETYKWPIGYVVTRHAEIEPFINSDTVIGDRVIIDGPPEAWHSILEWPHRTPPLPAADRPYLRSTEVLGSRQRGVDRCLRHPECANDETMGRACAAANPVRYRVPVWRHGRVFPEAPMSSVVTAIRLLYLENALRHDMPQELADDGQLTQRLSAYGAPTRIDWREFESGGVSIDNGRFWRVPLQRTRRIKDIFIASDSMVITNVKLDNVPVKRMSSSTVRRFHAFGQTGRHLKVFGSAIGRASWPYFRYLITCEK